MRAYTLTLICHTRCGACRVLMSISLPPSKELVFTRCSMSNPSFMSPSSYGVCKGTERNRHHSEYDIFRFFNSFFRTCRFVFGFSLKFQMIADRQICCAHALRSPSRLRSFPFSFQVERCFPFFFSSFIFCVESANA